MINNYGQWWWVRPQPGDASSKYRLDIPNMEWNLQFMNAVRSGGRGKNAILKRVCYDNDGVPVWVFMSVEDPYRRAFCVKYNDETFSLLEQHVLAANFLSKQTKQDSNNENHKVRPRIKRNKQPGNRPEH